MIVIKNMAFIVERFINAQRSTINDSNTCNNFVHLPIFYKDENSPHTLERNYY